MEIGHVLLLAVLKDRADRHGAGICACRLMPAKGVTRAFNLIVLLFDPELGLLQGSLLGDSLMLECGHPIVAQVLVEGVDHGVDRLLGATVTVRSLMMRFRPVDSLYTFVTIGEGTNRGEVFLGLIRIDLLSIKLGVLRENLWLNLIFSRLINLLHCLSQVRLGHVLG